MVATKSFFAANKAAVEIISTLPSSRSTLHSCHTVVTIWLHCSYTFITISMSCKTSSIEMDKNRMFSNVAADLSVLSSSTINHASTPDACFLSLCILDIQLAFIMSMNVDVM
jgi:hypothetical protein